ncbi:MAG: hypothetical protein ACTS27_03015 [Phycisphaerales bacterium]
MATAKSLATAFSVVSVSSALLACAAACPLGDCGGESSHQTTVVTFNGDGPGIYAGATGRFADDVNYTGSVVQTGRVVVFLEHQFGLYPRFHNGRRVNGGIPQNVNIPAHLNRMKRDIDRAIPRDFDGHAVMDFEAWKPLWSNPRLKDEYREASRQKVRQNNPGLSAAQVEARAAQEWDAAAKEFLLATLHEAKRLRPNATWGFYGYLGDLDEDTGLEEGMEWLWDEVDAFFPSVYMRMVAERNWTRTRGTVSESEQRERVRDKIDSAHQIADGRPVVPFVWRLYKPQNPLRGGQPLNDLDFTLAFDYPIELGADGLILWEHVNSRADQREYERALRGSFGDRLSTIFGAAGDVYVPPERRRAEADR